jgi:hypothetical protein
MPQILDPAKNFAVANVLTGYAAGITTIVLQSGLGALFPSPSTDGAFNLVYWNATDYPNPSDDPDKEIVRCTARSTDTLTITRAQESTSDVAHDTVGKQYKVALGWTKKMRDDVEAELQGIANYPEVIYNTNNYQIVYFDDLDNIMAGIVSGQIAVYKTNYELGPKYVGANLQLISAGSLLAGATDRSVITCNGFHYAYINTGASRGMYRIAVGSDISVAGNWTTLTLSGALFTFTARLIGFDGTNFWFTDGSTQFFKATLSGTTMTQGVSVNVTGSSYSVYSRVNSQYIYAPFGSNPRLRLATLAGALVTNKTIGNVGVVISIASPLYLYTAADINMYIKTIF